jgi:hypothetical protein
LAWKTINWPSDLTAKWLDDLARQMIGRLGSEVFGKSQGTSRWRGWNFSGLERLGLPSFFNLTYLDLI